MKITEARQGFKGTPPCPSLQLRPRTHRWRLTGGAVDLASRIVGLHLHGSHGDVILLGHLSSSSTINIRYKYICMIYVYMKFRSVSYANPFATLCSMHFPKTYCKNFTFFSARVFFFFSVFCFRFTVFFFLAFSRLLHLHWNFVLYQKRTNSDEKVKGVQFIRVGTIQFDTLCGLVWFS